MFWVDNSVGVRVWVGLLYGFDWFGVFYFVCCVGLIWFVGYLG